MPNWVEHEQSYIASGGPGSKGRSIREKQLANIQNWENRLEKLNSLFYFTIIQKHGKLRFTITKYILKFVSENIHKNLPQTWM